MAAPKGRKQRRQGDGALARPGRLRLPEDCWAVLDQAAARRNISRDLFTERLLRHLAPQLDSDVVPPQEPGDAQQEELAMTG